MSTNSIRFSPMSVDGPPEVEIPLDEDTLQYRFVGDMNKEDDETLVVGIQFLVGGNVKHSQRFRRPLRLSGMNHDVTRISVMMLQVIGIPANDGKQQNILLGDISNSGICACPSCTCMRVNFGKWSRRLLKHSEEKICAAAAAKKESFEPNLRIRKYSCKECAKIYDKKTIKGKWILTAKQRRSLIIECANVVAPPFFSHPPKEKQS